MLDSVKFLVRQRGKDIMKRKKVITLIAAALAFTMTVCGSSTAITASELTAESKLATQYTIDANQGVYALLDFEIRLPQSHWL